MKMMRLLLSAVVFLWGTTSLLAQINSGSPTVPFGSNLSYDYGIMPSNLPTSGPYGRSQAAADQYNYWVNQFVEPCNDGTFRVKFDNPDQTVSEGIAYGMLLSAYAGDKVHFDGFWKFFKNSMNSRGLMNWMTDGCAGNARDNAATDADLDAAHALIIAQEQFGGTYEADAKTLLGNIMQYEIDPTSFLTLSGDAWGSDACLNPSYQAPAYYRQFAQVHTAKATEWGKAVTAAENLLELNADAGTGLVSNWCDKTGAANTCGPNNPYPGYGSDACRTPWRMAMDVLWHGSSSASTAFTLSKKMADWLAGEETSLSGKMAQDAKGADQGIDRNGSYTTFALAPMAMDASYQESLNKCYTYTAAMSHDNAYFNETVRCLSLFTLTGNFWKPGTGGVVRAPEILSAESNGDGTQITVTFTKAITSNLGSASSFTVSKNGVAVSGAVTAIAADGTNAVILTIATDACQAGKAIGLAYNGTTIESTDGAKLASFSDQYVKNNLAGNSTLIDNCDDGNATNMIGGVWFTFDDASNGGLSTVTPLSTAEDPLQMLGDGADGSAKSAKMEFYLDKGTNTNKPFVGMGTTLNDADLSLTSGMSFWYKGGAFRVKVILTTVTDYAHFGVDVPAAATWTHFSKEWSEFAQPTWGTAKTLNLAYATEFQWQVEDDAAIANAGDKFLFVDFVECNGLVPTPLTSMEVEEATDAVGDDFVTLYTDPADATQFTDTTLHITYTPANATYKEVIWTSANPSIASIKFNGEVTAYASGLVRMTATAGVDEAIVATCEVKVVGPETLPETVTVSAATSTTIAIAGTVQLSATVLPADTDDKSLIWTSSSASAVVDANGLVTGVSAGTATIKATSTVDNTVFGEMLVTVEGAADVLVETISGLEATKDLVVGEEYTFSVIAGPSSATNKTLVWESDNAAVTVDQNGKIKAISAGTAVITVSSEDAGDVAEVCTVSVSTAIVPVESVVLDETSIQLAINATKTLTATVGPTGATDGTVTWTSNKPTVVSVSTDGKLTALAAGTGVIITATTNGTDSNGDKLTAICAVEVLAGVKPVETVTITQGATLSLVKGTKSTLDATVLPTDADETAVVWSSLDPANATVSATGEVSALLVGSARIVATAADGYGAADTITVTVDPILVADILVSPTLTIEIGEVSNISVSVDPADADNTVLTWTSLNTGFATVNGAEITGVAAGIATITVASTDGSSISKSITVTVIDPNTKVDVSSISISDATLALTTGGFQSISAEVNTDATVKDIIWTTDKPEFATVDATGKITAVAQGVAVITATAKDDNAFTATCTVTVTDVPVSAITLSSLATVSIEKGKTSQITATANASATNTGLLYVSDKPEFATVDANGLVTAKAAGTAVITITPADGSSVSETVTVTVTETTTTDVLVSSITLNKSEIKLVEGKNTTLSAIQVSPSNATNSDLVWASSNEAVVTYLNGTVTAVAPGTATIIASSADAGDAVATCVVIVSADVTLVDAIALNKTSLELAIAESSVLTATVSPSTATTPAIVWVSSNAAVAKVVNGTVTALGSGLAVITAKSTDGSGVVASVPVTVKASSSTALATSIVISGSSPKMKVNESATLSAIVVSNAGTPDQAVQWMSSNSAVLSVLNGYVTAKSAGSATITAIAKDGSFISSSVTISVEAVPVAVTSVNASFDVTGLTVGEVAFITSSVEPVSAVQDVKITVVSGADFATLDQARGTLKAIAAGDVVLKVTSASDPSQSKQITITVTEPAGPVLDLTILNSAIEVVQSVSDQYKNMAVADQMVAMLWLDLNNAIKDAKKVLPSTDQAEINKAATDLLDEVQSFRSYVVGTAAADVAAVETVVSPSPATDAITVSAEQVIETVSIVSADGYTAVLATDVNATSVQASVADFTSGVYEIVVVFTNGSVETISIAIQ